MTTTLDAIKTLEGALTDGDRIICIEESIDETSIKKAQQQRMSYTELFFKNYFGRLYDRCVGR